MGFVEFHSADDKYIWNKFREGSANAFEIIYERHIKILANYGLRIHKDDELVKDAIQDMFIDIWRNRTNLGSTDSIKFYLLKAFRRNLIRKIDAKKRFVSDDVVHNVFDGFFEISHELAIIKTEIEKETLDQLNQIINTLPARQKEALFLRFYAGLNFKEISETMGINQQSAHNMVFKALSTLRKNMPHKIALAILVLATLTF